MIGPATVQDQPDDEEVGVVFLRGPAGWRRPDLVESPAELITVTCCIDDHDHLISAAEYARTVMQGAGVFPALCAHQALPAAMSSPSGPVCRECAAVRRAR